MEVHTHTHTPRRKWTHYFWEFLMLFLAVFCGFLAEYQLEHKIERDRGKIYALNLYNELKIDTARLNEIASRVDSISKKLDTLCLYMSEKPPGITNGMLYYYASFTTNVEYFTSNNATIEQLKGSGNLRLLKNNVAHKISEFDKKLRELQNEYSLSKSEFENMEILYFKIFDVYLTQKFFPRASYHLKDSVFKLNPPLISTSQALIKEFVGWAKFESGIYQMQISIYLNPIKDVAVELLALLKKEYRLK